MSLGISILGLDRLTPLLHDAEEIRLQASDLAVDVGNARPGPQLPEHTLGTGEAFQYLTVSVLPPVEIRQLAVDLGLEQEILPFLRQGRSSVQALFGQSVAICLAEEDPVILVDLAEPSFLTQLGRQVQRRIRVGRTAIDT